MAAYTTIDNPELFFQCKLYTGNSAHYITGDSQAITFDGSEDMSPNLVWIKSLTQGGVGYNGNHCLFDSVRGTTKFLFGNETTVEQTQSGVTAFSTDGFTVGPYDMMNDTGDAFVAWCWKAGTAFSNDASATSVGNTDSSGSASSIAGFSIAIYEGAGSSTDIVVKHGLSVVPSVMITRNRDDANSWAVYHHKNTSAPETDYLKLDTNAATADQAEIWHDTAPTSAVFTAGDHSSSNRSGDSFVSYFWNEVQGFSKFGTYTGNNNADGPFVYTGFRPAFVMVKRTDSTGGWRMLDNKRNSYNGQYSTLVADTTEVDYTANDDFGNTDLLANGFKIKLDFAQVNASGGSFVYMAFAEAPFVNSNGVPCNAR
jgi:hypothetical protein